MKKYLVFFILLFLGCNQVNKTVDPKHVDSNTVYSKTMDKDWHDYNSQCHFQWFLSMLKNAKAFLANQKSHCDF
jgi:uncharacterized protein YceK